MKTAMAIVTFFLSIQSLFSQENNWHLKLVNGDTIANVDLQSLVGDSLAISHSGQPSLIPVESIVEMRKTGTSKFWKGAGIGFAAGAGVGALIAAATYEESSGPFAADPGRGGSIIGGAIIGGVPGFVIGGLVGSSAGKEKTYDLSQQRLVYKLAIIRSIVSE